MRRILTIILFSLALLLVAACNFSFTGNLPATIVAGVSDNDSATSTPLGQPTWTRVPGSTPTRIASVPTAISIPPTAVVPNCTPRNDWRTPVIKTSASTGIGIDELMGAVQKHRQWAVQGGEAQRRSAEAMRTEIQALMRERVIRELARRTDPQRLEDVVSQVVNKRLDPYAAVDELLGPEATS